MIKGAGENGAARLVSWLAGPPGRTTHSGYILQGPYAVPSPAAAGSGTRGLFAASPVLKHWALMLRPSGPRFGYRRRVNDNEDWLPGLAPRSRART